jgi:hypothetical protein
MVTVKLSRINNLIGLSLDLGNSPYPNMIKALEEKLQEVLAAA